MYYTPKPESDLNLELLDLLDKKHINTPFYGVPRLYHWLRHDNGYNINKKRVERLCRIARIQAIGPKPNTSKPNKENKVYPYLLRGLKIEENNQVWATDITYIPMAKGFMYLTAIIDINSRYLVSWSLSNTMTSDWCCSLLKEAVTKHGKPQILNTDQGSQYTSKEFTSLVVDDLKIKLSMDGKGRALDNIFIERFWRSLKQEYIYLNPEENGKDLYKGCKKWIDWYNSQRPHQSLDYQTPEKKYFSLNQPQLKMRAS